MKSKEEIITEELAGLHVLDIGGAGFGEDNAYERGLAMAWKRVASRTVIDDADSADIHADLNKGLPPLPDKKRDVTTLFDILEHLENPTAILRSIPTQRALISLPNVLSPFCRMLEKKDLLHLYSFTDYTAKKFITNAGWSIERFYYTFGKWSYICRIINAMGTLAPSRVGSGMMFYCKRT